MAVIHHGGNVGSLRIDDAWFRTLAETTTVSILVYDRDRFYYLNPAAASLTGYTLDELLATSPPALVHPDSRQDVEQRIERRLRGDSRSADRYEVRLVTRDGERWVEINADTLEAGGRTLSLATAVDITERRQAEQEARESRQRLELAQKAAHYISWEWQIADDSLSLIGDVAEVFGIPQEMVGSTGTDFIAHVHPEDRERFSALTREAITGSGDLNCEIRVVSPAGEVRWLGERARVVRDDSGWALRLVGVATDITERKRAEEALHQETERAQVTLASIGDGVIRTDAEGRIDLLNPVAERLTGWTLEAAMGRPIGEVFQVVDESSRKPLMSPVADCLEGGDGGELPGYSLLVGRDGAEHAIQDSAAPIRDREGRVTGAVLVFKDVSELRGLEREMSYLATHDPLTGLINRSEFESRLHRCLRTARENAEEHALCYLDLDEFKVVNDTCGHVAGDEMLRQVAALLQATVLPGDTLARLGGDEFGVLLENAPATEARDLAERMRAALADFRFLWQETIFEPGVSIGLVPIHGASGDLAQVLSAADAACYVAKEGGGNRMHEYQPDDRALAERYGEMQWIHRIHKAFEDHRFRLYRQFIRPLRGAASGPPLVEILLRLVDEDGELVLPGEFIPAAERYHLIRSIDRWVVATAFDTLAERWRSADDGDATCYCLNLSGQSLGEETFLDHVVARLEASGIDPARICFEITETAAVGHLARAVRFISVLRGLGCRFVLDDFGSGLSSFAYLKNLRVDFLKIAGDFVRGMADKKIERALVASIHEIGHVMKIRTIAEEVETPATLAAVEELGIDYAQGYLIGRPEPL